MLCFLPDYVIYGFYNIHRIEVGHLYIPIYRLKGDSSGVRVSRDYTSTHNGYFLIDNGNLLQRLDRCKNTKILLWVTLVIFSQVMEHSFLEW